MTNSERVLADLSSIAPKSVTNAEIRAATGIKLHQQIFQITDYLMNTGRIKGRQFGKEGQFWVEMSRTPLTQEPSRGATSTRGQG